MQQRDYLLREIEKIGAIIQTIRQKLLGGTDKLSINIEQQVEEAKGMLLNDLDFDMDKFLALNDEAAFAYINKYPGFTVKNMEALALWLSEIGTANHSNIYLEKALFLYEHCNTVSKTFSMERENNIDKIKGALN